MIDHPNDELERRRHARATDPLKLGDDLRVAAYTAKAVSRAGREIAIGLVVVAFALIVTAWVLAR